MMKTWHFPDKGEVVKLGGQNILIIEPDEITRILLAKEVEQTKNVAVSASSIRSGFDALMKKRVSLIICDSDLLEGTLLGEKLLAFGYGIPVITTSTFMRNQNFSLREGIISSLKKPVDWEGYEELQKHIKGLKETGELV